MKWMGAFLSSQFVVDLWDSLLQDVVMVTNSDGFKRELDKLLADRFHNSSSCED